MGERVATVSDGDGAHQEAVVRTRAKPGKTSAPRSY